MTKQTRIGNYLTSPRVIAAIITLGGATGTAVATILQNPYTIVYPPLILLGAIVGIKANPTEANISQNLNVNPRFISIIYSILLSAIIALFSISGQRTFLAFILTIGLYGLVLLSFCSGHTKLTITLLLTTAIIHRATMYFSGAALFGNDTFFHSRHALEISKEGSVLPLEGTHYFRVPLYHILIATGVQLFDLKVRAASFISISLSYIPITAGSVYLITRHIYTKNHGIMAMYIYLTSDYALGWSIRPTTTTLGLMFFTIIIATVISYVETRDSRFHIIMSFMIIAVALAHHISSFLTFISLGLVGLLLYISTNHRSHLLPGSIAVIVTVTSWAGATLHINGNITTFLAVGLGRLATRVLSASPGARQSMAVPADIAVGGASALTPLHVLGGGLIVGLGIVGLIWSLQEQASSIQQRHIIVALVGTSGTLLVLTFVGPLFGVRFLQPMRFFQFVYFLITIATAYAVIRGICSFHGKVKYPIFIIGVLILTVLMGGTFIGSFNDAVFDNAPGAQRYQMTNQEHATYQFAATKTTDDIVTSQLGRVVITRYYGGKARRIAISYKNKQVLAKQNDIILTRPYIYTKHAWITVVYKGRRIPAFYPVPENICGTSSQIYTAGQRHTLQALSKTCAS